jgi:hypothetical protein
MKDMTISSGDNAVEGITGREMEIIAEFELESESAAEFGFKVRTSADNETVIGYDVASQKLFVDRTNSGTAIVHPNFNAKHTASLAPDNNRIKMHIFVDWSTVEVFGNDGKAVISDLIFPDHDSQGMEIYAIDGNVRLVNLQINDMQSIWRDDSFNKIRMDNRSYKLNTVQKHQTAVGAVTVTDSVYTTGADIVDVTHLSLYTSSNPEVASVNAGGLVTALKKGETVIEATYGSYKATASVTVLDAVNPPDGNQGGDQLPISNQNDTVTKENGIIKIKLLTKRNALGDEEAIISEQTLKQALGMTDIGNRIVVEVSNVAGAKGYTIQLPAKYLSSMQQDFRLEIVTKLGSVILPSHMLSTEKLHGTETIAFTIRTKDLSESNPELKSQVGARPVLDLTISVDGKLISWNNSKAPVKVAIDYSPTNIEQKDLDHIVVQYVDNTGKAIAVPNGQYDADSGKVIFTTTHFSTYAVSFVKKTFGDLNRHPWAEKQIEALASRGIINGTSEGTFNPSGHVTRADFMLLLVRALELKAEAGTAFEDVLPDDYYYEELRIAKSLGIAKGISDQRFNPKGLITRQDMMVMTARALGAVNVVGSSKTTDLSGFIDANQVSDYAHEAVSSLVKQQLIEGDQGKLNPLGTTTRAEAAVILYRIWKSRLN